MPTTASFGFNKYKYHLNNRNVLPSTYVEPKQEVDKWYVHNTISLEVCTNIQNQKVVIDEPEPMQQELVSFHGPMATIENLSVDIENLKDSEVKEIVVQDFQLNIEAPKVPIIEEEGSKQGSLVLSKEDHAVFSSE